MKIEGVVLIAVALALSGCANKPDSIPVIVTKKEVLHAPPEYYQGCEKVPIPDEPLTDKKVSRYIFSSEKVISKCQSNLKSIGRYYKEADAELKKK